MQKRYPIGIQTFSEVITGKYQYIDKTGYVHEIAHKYKWLICQKCA